MVTALDCAAPKEELPPGVRFHLCEISEGLLPNKAFDAVVHLAALAGVRQSIDRKLDYEFTNVIGTIRLLEHCRRIGIPCPELPHRRQATDRRKDYRSYYTEDAAALVASHFAADVERFGYTFDPPGGS